MNANNVRLPYQSQYSQKTFAPSMTNGNAINSLYDFQNVSYEPKDLIELVDCLKAYGLLDDVPPSEKIMLDDFCDDLRLPVSERRFSGYTARRMSDFITRRFSLLPQQTKNSTIATRLQGSEDAAVSSQKAKDQHDMDENSLGMKNVSRSWNKNTQGHSDIQLFPYSSLGGQSLENMIPNYSTTNLYPPVNDMNMNAELYLAIHDRLRRLKQEELQLQLLLQTTPNPFQSESYLQDGDMSLLGLSQGLDLESQRQLRRLSLLAVAEAIGLPPQDIINMHLNRRDSFVPFLGGSTDFNSNIDYIRRLQTGGINPSSPLQDFNKSECDYGIDQPSSHHHQESSGDLTSSILDEVDTDALVTSKRDDHEEQRRGSLDLLGTVAAAASENHTAPQDLTSKGNSKESLSQDYIGTHLNKGQQPLTLSPRGILGNFDLPDRKRRVNESDTRDSFDIKRVNINSISEELVLNSDEMRQVMENLKQAMIRSQTSQKNIQKWDRQFGLKRSHSMTMTKTAKSRSQVRFMLDQRTMLPTSNAA